MNLKELLEQPHGFTPPTVAVKIAKIWDRKTGTGEYGEWSFQNCDAVDRDGNKGTITLKNIGAMPKERQGQTVKLAARSSDKHGLTGLKVEHKEYKGKKQVALIVTGSADWTWLNGDAQQSAAQQDTTLNTEARIETPHDDLKAAFVAHLQLIQDFAIDLRKRAEGRLGRALEHADPSIITANQIVMAARDNALWFTAPAAATVTEQGELSREPNPDDIQDDDIPF